MEQVQLKRQSRCEPEVERNLVIKRSRIEEENVETIPKTKAPATSSPIRSASPIIPTILPNVSWSAKIRPYKIIPYRACAIFDTCSLIKNCAVLDDAVESEISFCDNPSGSLPFPEQILSVIPYSVICELDGLKNNSDLRPAAQEVNWKLKELCNEKNHYLHIETSVEQCIAVPEYMANPSVKDDLILKCALRIKKEVASIVDTLKLNEAAILFVTDDTNLGLKADAHGMIVENVEDFLNVINDRPKAPPKKKAERRSVPEDLYREPRNSYSNQAVRKGYPVRNNRSSAQYEERKSITAMKLEETRKGKEWIMMIARRAAEKERLMTPERKIAETETVRNFYSFAFFINSSCSRNPAQRFHSSTNSPRSRKHQNDSAPTTRTTPSFHESPISSRRPSRSRNPRNPVPKFHAFRLMKTTVWTAHSFT